MTVDNCVRCHLEYQMINCFVYYLNLNSTQACIVMSEMEQQLLYFYQFNVPHYSATSKHFLSISEFDFIAFRAE